MSSLPTSLKVAGAAVLAIGAGTAYVLIHEHRRKQKKDKVKSRAGGEGSSSGLDVEKLVFVLGESANGAYQLIEQTRRMVHEKHVQTGQPLESCVDALQKDFEAASASQHARSTMGAHASRLPPHCMLIHDYGDVAAIYMGLWYSCSLLLLLLLALSSWQPLLLPLLNRSLPVLILCMFVMRLYPAFVSQWML